MRDFNASGERAERAFFRGDWHTNSDRVNQRQRLHQYTVAVRAVYPAATDDEIQQAMRGANSLEEVMDNISSVYFP